MDTFIERIVKEKEELDIKRHALRAFLYTPRYEALPGMQQVLLVKQNNIMEQYSDILQERLRLLTDDDAKPVEEFLGELDQSRACSTAGEACDSCS